LGVRVLFHHEFNEAGECVMADALSGYDTAVVSPLFIWRPKPRFRLREYPFLGDETEGWELSADSTDRSGEFTPIATKFLSRGKSDITGEEVLTRACNMGKCAGRLHAKAMLQNQHRIPKEYRQYVLMVVGTIWLSGGRRKIMCLFWTGFGWAHYYDWLSADFDAEYRVLLCE